MHKTASALMRVRRDKCSAHPVMKRRFKRKKKNNKKPCIHCTHIILYTSYITDASSRMDRPVYARIPTVDTILEYLNHYCLFSFQVHLK